MVCRDPREVVHNNPKTVFTAVEAARTRAEQLVKDTGHRFYVLTPILLCEPSAPPVEWTVLE